jgi:TRAP-type C4-dicarboxylate transport system permease small subunit
MWVEQIIARSRGIFSQLIKVQANLVAPVCIGFIILLTIIDIVGRKLRHPVAGAAEICCVTIATAVMLSWAYTQNLRGNVSLDLLVRLFKPRVRAFFQAIGWLIGFMVSVAIAWQGIIFGLESWRTGEVMDIIKFPIFAFKFVMFWGGVTLALQFGIDIIQVCREDIWK